MIKKVSNLIKSTAGLLALLPGIAILVANLQTPPKIGDVYGGLVSIIGFVIVLATQALYPQIRRLSWPKTLALTFALLLTGFCSLFLYKSAFDSLIRTYPYEINKGHFENVALVLPLHIENDLEAWMNETEIGGDWAMALAINRVRLEELLAAQNTGAHALLMGIFLLLFGLLISAMTLMAWRAAADIEAE